MPAVRARQLAVAVVFMSMSLGYFACSSPPPYDGGGRVIDNAIVSGSGTSTPKDSGVKDTSIPDTSIPDAFSGG